MKRVVILVVGVGLTLALLPGCRKKGLQPPKEHRAVATACPVERPPTEEPVIDPDHPTAACRKHADCKDGKNGRCVHPGRQGWVCQYDACSTDDDCGANKVCQCRTAGSQVANGCIGPGNCRVDADCGGKGACSPSLGSCGNYGGIRGYFCHTPADECASDDDCPKEKEPKTQFMQKSQGTCRYEESVGHWACSWSECQG